MTKTQKNPLVTVAVLVYKNTQYLGDCLGSIFEQKYDNIQLIVSDDGSPEFSCDVIDEMIRRADAKNIKAFYVHKMESNEGTSKNFNYVLSLAEGTYIKYIAADDLFYDQHSLGHLVAAAEEDSGNVVIARAANYDMYLNRHEWTYPSDENWLKMKAGATNPRYFFGLMSQYCLISAPSTLFRTDFLRKHGGADERYPLIEDWPLWMKMLRTGEMFTFLDRSVVIYRSGGVSNGKTNEKFAVHQIEYADVIRNECLSHPEAMASRTQYKNAVRSERIHRCRGELLLAKEFKTKIVIGFRYLDVIAVTALNRLSTLLKQTQSYKRRLVLFGIMTYSLFSITDVGIILGDHIAVGEWLRTIGLVLGGVSMIIGFLLYLVAFLAHICGAIERKEKEL